MVVLLRADVLNAMGPHDGMIVAPEGRGWESSERRRLL